MDLEQLQLVAGVQLRRVCEVVVTGREQVVLDVEKEVRKVVRFHEAREKHLHAADEQRAVPSLRLDTVRSVREDRGGVVTATLDGLVLDGIAGPELEHDLRTLQAVRRVAIHPMMQKVKITGAEADVISHGFHQ